MGEGGHSALLVWTKDWAARFLLEALYSGKEDLSTISANNPSFGRERRKPRWGPVKILFADFGLGY